MRRLALATLVTLLALALAAPAAARTLVVASGGSIQAAVDRASPGDRIVVRPGLYTPGSGESQVVSVQTDDLELIGLPGAVIDAEGRAEYGVVVGPMEREGCLEGPVVQSFRLHGFTVRNATDTGVLLNRVQDFELVGTRYRDNVDYGPFPICSRDGRIAQNDARGHDDAAIYVGNDENVVVENNIATDNTIGVEVENSRSTVVRRNVLYGNTGGILVVALPDLPRKETRDTEVIGNYIADNNRPNPFEPGPRAISTFPQGSGILNIGGDALTVRRNVILQNGSFGMATLGNFFSFEDPELEPFVDGQVVRGNVILRNGGSPDPLRLTLPPADVVFVPDLLDPATGDVVQADPDPSDNCFERNLFETDFPAGVVDAFPCP